jgi:hypothetical protein
MSRCPDAYLLVNWTQAAFSIATFLREVIQSHVSNSEQTRSSRLCSFVSSLLKVGRFRHGNAVDSLQQAFAAPRHSYSRSSLSRARAISLLRSFTSSDGFQAEIEHDCRRLLKIRKCLRSSNGTELRLPEGCSKRDISAPFTFIPRIK